MTKKENLDLLYTVLGEICLSADHMEEEDKEKISDLIEDIIKIFESYEESNENL